MMAQDAGCQLAVRLSSLSRKGAGVEPSPVVRCAPPAMTPARCNNSPAAAGLSPASRADQRPGGAGFKVSKFALHCSFHKSWSGATGVFPTHLPPIVRARGSMSSRCLSGCVAAAVPIPEIANKRAACGSSAAGQRRFDGLPGVAQPGLIQRLEARSMRPRRRFGGSSPHCGWCQCALASSFVPLPAGAVRSVAHIPVRDLLPHAIALLTRNRQGDGDHKGNL